MVQDVRYVDRQTVLAYASDLRSLLSEGDITESKSFLRTFVKKIVVEKEQVTVHYNLPVPAGRNEAKITEVLPR